MSYGTPPPPPPGYGGGYAQPRTSGLAIASLVCGILGIIPCCSIGILGILGIVFGVVSRRNIERSAGAQKGLGLARAGLICGIVGLVLGVLYWIYAVSSGNTNVYFHTS